MNHASGRWPTSRGGALIVSLVLLASLTAGPRAASADSIGEPWLEQSGVTVTTAAQPAGRPAFAYDANGAAHALWESSGQIFYAMRLVDGGWSYPRRVAAGTDPSVVLDSAGQLHAVFANQFMGEHQIYHIRKTGTGWTLPVAVSRTSGYSAMPELAIDRYGALQVTWMDNSPGYWIVYHGTWDGRFWSSQPIPSGRGETPAVAASATGSIFVAWQSQTIGAGGVLGARDIFLVELNGSAWSFPVNVSDNPTVESLGADLTTTADGIAHLTWVDANREVRYSFGQGAYWSTPRRVTYAASTRGPRIVAERGTMLHIAWDEGTLVRVVTAEAGTTLWPKAQVAATSARGSIKDVRLALSARNGVILGWVEAESEAVRVFESTPQTAFDHRSWLPSACQP